MQKDLHYYTIYFLCIAAGFPTDEAYKIAYSSQYVDDSKDGNYTKLIFKESGAPPEPFEPVRTAHNGFESMGEGVQYKVYFPFHFLPGMKGNSYEEKTVTKPGKKGDLFQDVIKTAKESENAFRIGITLHVLADTFSHENFSGLWSRFNFISKVSFVPVRKSWISALMNKVKWKFGIYNLAPAIGHGRAGHLPDIPFMSWSYLPFSEDYRMVSNNLKFFHGMLYLYDEFLCNLNQKYKPRIDQDTLNSILWEGIFRSGRLKKRCKFWEEQITILRDSQGLDVPPEHMRYKEGRWIKEIGKWKKKSVFSKSEILLKVSRNDYNASNFRHFHKQAWAHRIYIIETLKKKLIWDKDTEEGKYLSMSADEILKKALVKVKSV